MHHIALIGAVVVLIVMVVGGVASYFSEKKVVRAGHCGLPWRSFDMASDGSIGLKCQKCGTYGPWVSWYTKSICTRSWVPKEAVHGNHT